MVGKACKWEANTRIRCPLKGMCCILTTILSEALTLGNDLLEIFYSQNPIHCAKKQMTRPNKNVIALQET